MQTAIDIQPGYPDPLAFSFGGVSFDVHPSPELRWELHDEHRLFRYPNASRLRLHLVVEPAGELEMDYGREIAWTWEGDRARVKTGGSRAELRDLGDGQYAAWARVAPDARGCSSVCTALATAVLYRSGGVVLHASGIEVDGGAVLFIGPSGAGKTTAANHCSSARWFARDRAALLPTERGWVAAALCGGDPVELVRSPLRELPLRAIVRVRRGEDEHRLTRSSPLSALVHLRESLQMASLDAAGERAMVDRALGLASEVVVGELRSVLGSDLVPALSEWLSHEGRNAQERQGS